MHESMGVIFYTRSHIIHAEITFTRDSGYALKIHNLSMAKHLHTTNTLQVENGVTASMYKVYADLSTEGPVKRESTG